LKQTNLPAARVRRILQGASKVRILVVGALMLDQFIWGNVSRISPEAPVPVVEFVSESFMPGGAANVARNLTALNVSTELFGFVGQDMAAHQLKQLLKEQRIGCRGLVGRPSRPTSVKTRIVAHKQQLVRIDRESRETANGQHTRRLLSAIEPMLNQSDAVIVGDYGKGVITQSLLDSLKGLCRSRAIWLSLDPKPVHELNLSGLSLITPNRKEAFELTGVPDVTRRDDPLQDVNLLQAAKRLLTELQPGVLLITLGELGMLLCQHNHPPFHIPTTAKEVFDVSGAGDTVIASFTLAIAAGASPLEAAVISNQAAGIVVAKIGTATVTSEELIARFAR